MLNWQEIVQNYIAKYHNIVKKTTQPLKDHFGIGYFTYHKIDNQNRYTVLVDRPDWAEYYVQEKIYLNDPYLRQASNYHSGMCLVEHNGSEEYKEMVIKAGKKVLDMDLGVLLIKKNKNGVEFFGFSANRKKSALEQIFLNEPHLLHSFANHFKKNTIKLLQKMDEESNNLFNLKGVDSLVNHSIKTTIENTTRFTFLNAIGMNHEVDQLNRLSQREKECLKLTGSNKTAKEIALILKLSHRTVESYIENIKIKLDCSTKQDLQKMAQIFDELKLF